MAVCDVFKRETIGCKRFKRFTADYLNRPDKDEVPGSTPRSLTTRNTVQDGKTPDEKVSSGVGFWVGGSYVAATERCFELFEVVDSSFLSYSILAG